MKTSAAADPSNLTKQSSVEPIKPTIDYFQSDTKLTLNVYCKR